MATGECHIARKLRLDRAIVPWVIRVGLAERHQRATVPDIREYNLAWQEWLNVDSILTVARLTAISALSRAESRGSHYRTDYPEPDESTPPYNVLMQQDGEAPKVWTEDVRLAKLQPVGIEDRSETRMRQ